MSTVGTTQVRNARSEPDAADHETQPSRQRVLKWVLLSLLVAAGLITLVWWLLIAVGLAVLLLWLPAVLLTGVLVAAVWRWS